VDAEPDVQEMPPAEHTEAPEAGPEPSTTLNEEPTVPEVQVETAVTPTTEPETAEPADAHESTTEPMSTHVREESEPEPAVTAVAEALEATAAGADEEPLREPSAEAPAETVAMPEAPPDRHPSHARAEPAESSFAGRAQIAERLGELPSTTDGAARVRPLPRVVAIANQKGGVGKTTTTVNLGAALSELDYRVLVVDLDPQGNATSGLGIDTRNFESSMYDVIMRDAPIEDCIEPTSVQNLFVTPATIDLAGVEIELVSAFSRELKLKRAIDTVVDDFDFVLIDCPPSLGLLTINGLAAASEVMVPIQCEYYALEGLSQLIRNVQLVASNLNSGLEISAIVLTMFDARTRLAIDVADEVRSHFKEMVCRSIIPRTVRLSEAPSFGQPITVFDPSSRGAVAYRELAKEVSDGAPKRSG
jgi:chromosome partitioning protein